MFCSIKLSEERKQNVFMSQFSSTKIFLSLGSFSSTPKTYLKTKSEKDKENSARRRSRRTHIYKGIKRTDPGGFNTPHLKQFVLLENTNPQLFGHIQSPTRALGENCVPLCTFPNG
jgi:hypothetical protein